MSIKTTVVRLGLETVYPCGNRNGIRIPIPVLYALCSMQCSMRILFYELNSLQCMLSISLYELYSILFYYKVLPPSQPQTPQHPTEKVQQKAQEIHQQKQANPGFHEPVLLWFRSSTAF
jgi:hypothetical protein